MTKTLAYHIKCKAGDVAKYVLLPGDPARAEKIAEYFDNSTLIAKNREFWTYTGDVSEVPISVTSTGIGGPSTAIAIEELYRCGARVFIRVGTSGALQNWLNSGDLVIATGAIRDEGTTRQYVPLAFPAVADNDVVNALIESAMALKMKYHVGIIHTKDAFYIEEPDDMPHRERIMQQWQIWVNSRALATEMEAATVFTLSSLRGCKGGAVLAVIGSTIKGKPFFDKKRGVEEAIKTAINAVKILHSQLGNSL